NALGADLVPDPATAGDFCHCFTEADVVALMDAANSVRTKLWRGRAGICRPRGGLDSDNQVGRVLRRRTMKIGVEGATGRTGRQVAEQALARGDDVIALARHPEALPRLGPRMASAAADVLDRAAVAEALAGADAVVSALGIGASRQPTVVYSAGTAN